MKSFAILLLLLGELCSLPAEAHQVAGGSSRPDGEVEEIYIGRNIRESRSAPTEFCAQARTGFAATTEDRYTLRSIATRATDGRMVGANANVIGRFHACVGTPDAVALKFYAEGTVGRISLTVVGDCRALKQDFPETGVTASACAFDVRDLPTEYIGGQVTTNTVRSRSTIGDKSDPPGYIQPSVVTIRLWRRR